MEIIGYILAAGAYFFFVGYIEGLIVGRRKRQMKSESIKEVTAIIEEYGENKETYSSEGCAVEIITIAQGRKEE